MSALNLQAVPEDSASVLPDATEAEVATVGAVILGAAAIQDDTLAVVQDDDFADPKCRFAISTIRKMRAAGQPVDEVTISTFVERHALLGPGTPRVNLRTWLHDAADSAPSPANALWYAAAVIETAARRRALIAAERLETAAEGGSLADLAAIAQDELGALAAAIARAGERRG